MGGQELSPAEYMEVFGAGDAGAGVVKTIQHRGHCAGTVVSVARVTGARVCREKVRRYPRVGPGGMSRWSGPGAEAEGGWGADVRRLGGMSRAVERCRCTGVGGAGVRWGTDVLRPGGISPAGTREWRSTAGAARVR